MRVLVLGVAGMLGHKIYQVLDTDFDVMGTIRGSYADISKYGLFRESQILAGINAMDISRLDEIIRTAKPEAVINCIGITKHLEQSQNRLLSIWVNSLLPHQLYQRCHDRGIRLIHISTDCVFSGRKGSYREEDPSDAEDTYGKTKYLGEVTGDRALTIRTSIIGRELSTANGLAEWFMSNRGGKVNGFTRAIFSGFPTVHMARIIGDILTEHRNLSGIYHISAEPIDKFRLLTLINNEMGLGIEVMEDDGFYCDRSLNSTMYRTATGFEPLSWDRMIADFAKDAEQYQKWRQ